MKYRSIAKWPQTVQGLGNVENESTDTHDNKEAAEAVCRMLRRDGFGGDRKIFPLSTRVEGVWEQGDRVNVMGMMGGDFDATVVRVQSTTGTFVTAGDVTILPDGESSTVDVSPGRVRHGSDNPAAITHFRKCLAVWNARKKVV